MRHRYFVVIDDETMTTFQDAPDAVSEIPKGEDYWDVSRREDDIVIKIVDADYDEACDGIQFAAAGRGTPKDSPNSITFYGYMKTTPRWFRLLWVDIANLGLKAIFKGKDAVHKGGCGIGSLAPISWVISFIDQIFDLMFTSLFDRHPRL